MAVNTEIKGDKLIITCDMGDAARKAAQPSGSGKTVLVATTGGFTRIGDMSLSLNLTLPNAAYVAPAKD